MRYLKGGKGGVPVEVRASKEVILSGGAYNSPQLLQLSGVGSPELLNSLGIEVRHALSGVAEGLQDHYAPRSVARVKNIKTINELRRGLSLWVEALKWATTRRGLLRCRRPWSTASGIPARRTESSDLQLTFTPASYKEGVQGQLEDEPGMTVASWQQRPESRGYVRFRSADPFAAPIIQTNYLVEDSRPPRRRCRHEAGAAVAAIRAARAVLRLRGFPRAQRAERRRIPGRRDRARHHHLPSRLHLPDGTGRCRWAVVDDQLRVHGLQGLRVVDASVMPRMISANLNASTLMIADKAPT